MVLQLRRQVGFMIGGAAKGRFLTTTLGCEPTVQDPAVYIPIQVIKEWITMWQRNPHLHGRVCAAWSGIRDRLRRAGVRRWSS
eukprot:2823086-Pyramimonas_sp.AAC.1